MALPNNRRIFDMAAQAWKQSKTILSGPLEMPQSMFKRLDSLMGIVALQGSWFAPATPTTEVSVDGQQCVGFDLGRPGGDFSCIVQWDRQRVQAVRERWCPQWWVRRYPIHMRQISIHYQRYKAVCPHLLTESIDAHLRWMVARQEEP